MKDQELIDLRDALRRAQDEDDRKAYERTRVGTAATYTSSKITISYDATGTGRFFSVMEDHSLWLR